MGKRYDATRLHLKAHGLTSQDALQLVRTLCALIDHEGPIQSALVVQGHSRAAIHDVCNALRAVVDGDGRCGRLHVDPCRR